MSDDRQAAQRSGGQAAAEPHRELAERPGDRPSAAERRARSYWIGFLVGAVSVALVLLVAWPLIDRYVWVKDDRGLGQDFHTVVHPRDGECDLIAKALYGHSVHVLSNGAYDDEGFASNDEQAFYNGCTDSDALGGD